MNDPRMNDTRPAHPPAHYNDPAAVLPTLTHMLTDAVRRRHDDWHTPTLGYLDAAGLPALRTVVLRGFEAGPPFTLQFHTHDLASKIAALRAQPQASLHFYHRPAKIQIVCEGTASVHTDDDLAESAWSRTALFSRRCYMVEGVSGAPLAEPGSGFELYDVPVDRTPTAEESARGRRHFALVRVQVRCIDWLYLAMEGNRRARIELSDAGAQVQWVLP